MEPARLAYESLIRELRATRTRRASVGAAATESALIGRLDAAWTCLDSMDQAALLCAGTPRWVHLRTCAPEPKVPTAKRAKVYRLSA